MKDKSKVILAFMLAMAMDEKELVDDAMEKLVIYRNGLVDWELTGSVKEDRPKAPLNEVMLLLTKFHTIGMNEVEIFQHVMKQSEIVNTASELNDMINPE